MVSLKLPKTRPMSSLLCTIFRRTCSSTAPTTSPMEENMRRKSVQSKDDMGTFF